MGKSELKDVRSPFIKEFSKRLLEEAFKGRDQKAIANVIGTSEADLSKILNGSKVGFEKNAQLIISISEKAGCSTDWLLRGKGEGPINILDFLDPTVRSTVELIADIEGREPETLIADLVSDALEALAAHMIHIRRELRPTEVRKLQALLKLVEADVIAEVKPSTKRKRR